MFDAWFALGVLSVLSVFLDARRATNEYSVSIVPLLIALFLGPFVGIAIVRHWIVDD